MIISNPKKLTQSVVFVTADPPRRIAVSDMTHIVLGGDRRKWGKEIEAALVAQAAVTAALIASRL